jgi:hypothetical protein
VSNSTTASIAMKTGSGVSQTDPSGGVSYAYSQMLIDMRDATALRWDVTSPGFGPTGMYGSLTVTGSVGAGGFARTFVNLAWYRNTVSVANRIATLFLDTGTLSTAGAFTRVLSGTSPSVSLSTGDDILLIGTVSFQADNHLAPTEISLLDGSFGLSDSGRTVTYAGPPSGDWFDQMNWINDGAPANPVDSVGERAYLPNDNGAPRVLNLGGTPVTLGILDVNGIAGTSLVNSPTLTLQNQLGSRAMIFNRNVAGDGALVINPRVVCGSMNTEFLNDSTAPIQLVGGIRTTLAGGRIFKNGDGPLIVAGPIDHASAPDTQWILNAGTTTFNAEIGGGSTTASFAADVTAGMGTNVATAIFAATQRLDLLELGLRGRGIVNILPGRTAIAAETLTINTSGGSTARLDLTNDGLVVRVTGASPYLTHRGQIVSGFAGGSWNGVGINSSTAATGALSDGIGYALASDLFGMFGGTMTFLGQAFDSNDVLIRYTLLGDADLSGGVGIGDFSRLAAGFNAAGDWVRGDFNYDLQVNISDFSILAANFNQVLPADLPRGAAVPEPGVGMLAAAVFALARRQQRL